MAEFRCSECERDFASADALSQHKRDKHGAQAGQELKETVQTKKEQDKRKAGNSGLVRKAAYIGIPLLLIATTAFLFLQPQPSGNHAGTAAALPKGPVHWHPHLEIVINGEEQLIPADIGLAGVHAPVHTHDATGTLHYEIDNPTAENMRLGYFFNKVWRKTFGSTCIFNYCNNGSAKVRMSVNGEENFDFAEYMPKDGDEIRIEYGEFGAA